jgi:hypothetical protein
MTQQRTTPAAGPAARIPHLGIVDDRLAAIHRRAGVAAILRDERLEIAIAEDGTVTARKVAGASR